MVAFLCRKQTVWFAIRAQTAPQMRRCFCCEFCSSHSRIFRGKPGNRLPRNARSKGAGAVFAVRRKRSLADFAETHLPSPPSADQQSVCRWKRRSSKITELLALAGSEGYGACSDVSPEATSYPGRTGRGSAGGTRSGPPARRCWRPRGSCSSPSPSPAWQ